MKTKSIGAQWGDWCKHYNGLMNDCCNKGIRYDDVADRSYPRKRPCFRDHNVAERCSHVSYPTPEECADHERKVREHVQEFFQKIADNVCPHCGKKIEQQKKIGRCLYAYPCSHRLGQVDTEDDFCWHEEEEEPDSEKPLTCPKCRERVSRDYRSKTTRYVCRCGKTSYEQKTLF